jgi:hypothetical protein
MSPLPGGVLSGYAGDTGLDIAANHARVFAIAAGTLDYAERGHTRWVHGRDTPNSVRLALDAPMAFRKRRITHVYYTHLSALAFAKAEGDTRNIHVEAGESLGVSGIGNGMPHLHIGLLLDGRVEQDSWEFILREQDIREVFGGYRNGERLAPL